MNKDPGPQATDLSLMRGIAFVTDRNGQIRDIGARNWNAFAISNNAPNLRAERVIGRNIFDFISGEDVKSHLRSVIASAFATPDMPQILEYRCDAPTTLRRVLQSVAQLSQDRDKVLFHSVEIEAHERPPIDLLSHQQDVHSDDRQSPPCVSICSWCQRIKYPPIGDENWMDSEYFAQMGGPAQARITHCICEDCFAELDRPPHVPSP